MTFTRYILSSFMLLVLFSGVLFAQIYPDQHYVLRIDSLVANIESNSGVRVSTDGKSLQLEDGFAEGYVILKPQVATDYFNQGLPSWNGTAPNNYSGFKIQMRFPYGTSWSPWLTVGYWKANIWSSYGDRKYYINDELACNIDIDYVKLSSYKKAWQFKVILTRTSASQPTPSLSKLSFFVSDSRTTSLVNHTAILNDKPEAIFVPTTFVYQYGVDPEIGPSICSPTSVSMILKSYGIDVDTYNFAQNTYDPVFHIFGVWPRVVQNASEFGLDGAVTRYRTWSETREVIAKGGRIAMSVGSPLYPSGHLIMIAGFNAEGSPIVHDPARSNGYSYVFNKSDLSHSWFDKGGIAYTFYPKDETVSVEPTDEIIADNFQLKQNYPNPFNPSTIITYSVPVTGTVRLTVMDLLGQEIRTLIDENQAAGNYSVSFNADNLPSGIYLYKLQTGSYSEIKKMMLLK